MKTLKVQEYLREGHSLEDLTNEFAIVCKKDKHEKLVILNYDQIESKKILQIPCECRALILEIGTWNIVSKAFTRFFNYGETAGDGINTWDLAPNFNFDECDYFEKRDGSLCSIFHYDGQWRIATRGTIDNDACPKGSDKTFTELIEEGLLNRIEMNKVFNGNLFHNFDPDITYIFELCSPKNQIVTKYITTELTLLGARTSDNAEINGRQLAMEADRINIRLPKKFEFNDVNALKKHLDNECSADFEGVVAKGRVSNEYGDVQRVKIKKDSYVALHHMLSKIGTQHAILGIVIKNEQDEVIANFPTYEKEIREIQNRYETYLSELNMFKTLVDRFVKDNKPIKADYARFLQKNISNKALLPFFFKCFDSDISSWNQYLNMWIESKGIKNVSKSILSQLK